MYTEYELDKMNKILTSDEKHGIADDYFRKICQWYNEDKDESLKKGTRDSSTAYVSKRQQEGKILWDDYSVLLDLITYLFSKTNPENPVEKAIRGIASRYFGYLGIESYSKQYNIEYDNLCSLKHNGELTATEWAAANDFLDHLYGDIPERCQQENP